MIHTIPTPEQLRRMPLADRHAWAYARRKGLLAFGNAETQDLARYRDDPVGYARKVLGIRLTDDQQQIALSVRDNRRTAVKASHAIGKTFLAAVLANFWFDCWDSHIVYITAPTWPQALGLTFKQVQMQRMLRQLPGEILDSGLVRDADRKRRGDHFIRALNADKQEGFQGEHSAEILIILEEAVGVPPHIWRAADGLLTSKSCRLLAIFNPTDEATEAGDMCRSPLVNVLSVSALNHPNILAQLDAQPIPFPNAVELTWLSEMLTDNCEISDTLDDDAFEWWAPDEISACLEGAPLTAHSKRVYYRPNAAFQGQVLGIWPTQADEQVIPRGWLESLPALEWGENDGPQIGCDCARFGADRTCICTRRGPQVLSLREIRHMDNLMVTEALREAAAAAGGDAKNIPIRIDVTGGLGTGPYDILRSEGYRAVPVNASAKPADEEHFRNRRSEMWFTMRERVRAKRLDLSRLPRDRREALIRELSTPKYKVDAGGKKVVEAKEEIKKRLAASPDLADAVNLAFTDTGRWWEDRALTEWLIARGSSTAKADQAPKQSIEAHNLAAWMGKG